MAAPLTVAAALRAASARLAESASPRLDAELLLAHSLGVTRTQLYTTPEFELEPLSAARFESLVDARARHTPLAYLTGRAEFWSLDFHVTVDVLVPRPETELLVELALAAWPAGKPGVMIDLGTGSGAIAAAVAHERPTLTVFASDASAAALAVARGNFERLGLSRINCLRGDWLTGIDAQCVDVILANPPYVAADDVVDTAVSFEPPQAVFAAGRGSAALAAIVSAAPRCLKPGGYIALEHGFQQGEMVRELLASHGFARIETQRDLAGQDRVTSAWRD